MSQFLWIEDFDKNPKTTTESVFGIILHNAKIPNTLDAIKDFLKGPKYRVLVEFTFWDGWLFIHNPKLLSQVDYIILDIDLNVLEDDEGEDDRLLEILKRYGYQPSDDKGQDTRSYTSATNELKKVAGYQLYVELVMKLGFPEDHILFCSNHGEEMQKIQKAFTTAKMQLPQILTKNEKAAAARWISERRKNAYAVLRRGIIEACQRISSLIENHPEFIQFGDFLIEPNGTTVRDVTVKDMQEYLETLQNLLPLRQPQELPRFYKLLVRTLTHEWDSAAPKLQIDDKVNFTFGWIMKNARNWSTHTTVLDELGAQDVAFLFIVAMRAMFKLGTAPQAYETYLLTLFEEIPNLDVKKIPLAATYSKLKSKLLRERADDALYFGLMLNNLIKKTTDFDYVTGLFQIFWHGLAPARLATYRQGRVSNEGVIFANKYTFDIYHDFGKAEKGFLFKFARSIYKRSFP
ncbi:MAG: hypothetical protein ABFS56_23120 [Pseudomonadota bacterium]